MRARRRRVTQTPKPPVFFTDENLGNRVVPEALRAAGMTVERHVDHFPSGALDVEWLPEIGRRGWLLLTKDQQIRYRELERSALTLGGVGAFVLIPGNLSGPENAAILVRALPAMRRFATQYARPFIAGVHRTGRVTLLLGGR